MLPLFLAGIAIVSGIVLLDEGIDYSQSANMHDLFLSFEKRFAISMNRKLKVITSRKALQRKITAHFKSKQGVPVPKFYIQGSYKMKTMIPDKDNSYDIDLGVYFLLKPDVAPFTLQTWVFDAVNGHTDISPQHREKCIRVIYQGEYDIDLPVYYKKENDSHPFLATKNGWVESDPKELCDWFESKTVENGQLRRIIKYLKAWAQVQNHKMPSGIALTVLAANHYKANKRDDIAFYETARSIKSSLRWSIKCINPATPHDDLLARLNSQQKVAFEESLKILIRNAKFALHQNTIEKSQEFWIGVFGNTFIAT